MTILALAVFVFSVLLVLYTYVGYPLLLERLGPLTMVRPPVSDPRQWPTVSITVPAFNEEAQIRDTLEHLLHIDYPRDRLQILVVSDASTDGTDDIVREFEDRGVELYRLARRKGKTAAENEVASRLRGHIVVNTDASIRIRPDAIRALVRRFTDPAIGLASGRDVSVTADHDGGTAGESGYVGYEMRVRALESKLGGIVGASGCLYAIRAHLHRTPLPGNLSRDFASALVTHERGYRAVSVDDAVCYVPRTPSLRKEYRRKVRTMVRGIRTLWYKRHLLDPRRHGIFALQLFSHKVCRWLVPWALLAGGASLLVLTAGTGVGTALVVALGALVVVSLVAWAWPVERTLPRLLSLPAFAVWSNLAAIQALLQAPSRRNSAVWEPTRRKEVVG
jgi:cellulose synthase/poly-beta-1,6-N-acetylglucosamine synthase-like glycosyltransferase